MTTARDRLLPGNLARLHLLTDMVLLWGVITLVAFRHIAPSHLATGDWVSMGLILSGAWALIGMVLRHYGDGPVRPLVEDVAVVSLLVGVCSLILAATRLLVPNPAALPPIEPFLLLAWTLAVLVRTAVFRPIQRRHGCEDEILVLGVGPLARATARSLAISSPRRRIIGHVALPGERIPSRLRRPLVGRIENLEQILHARPVAEVFIAIDPCRQPEEAQIAIGKCERVGMPFALPIPPLRFQRARPIEPAVGGPIALDGYVHFSPTAIKPYQMSLKRLLDMGLSLLGLLALLPLLATVAVGVKLSSPGPVFFAQERVGMHGRRFGMLKFRSMYADAEARRQALESMNEQEGPVFKIKNDPRITPLGRVIRKYSIDELPQLINVFRGDMSLVGPRPPLPAEVERYQPWQLRRLSVKPGLTCIWQVSGRNDIGFDDWMLLDMRYIDNWGLGSDLGLILRTIPVVVTGKGAS